MGFKISYFSVYIRLFLNYSVCVCMRRVCVCVCVRLSAPCVRTRLPRRTLIGLDGLGKVTSLPDCVDFPPERSNRTGRSETLLHAAVRRKPKICSSALAAMITPSPLSATDTAEDRGQRLCISLVLIFNFHRGILFFLTYFFHYFCEAISWNLKTSERREIKRDSETRRDATQTSIW